MIIQDVYEDLRNVTGYAPEPLIFDRITDAVEVLSNKGLVETQFSYLDIPIPESGLISLPREVDTPLKINVDGKVSFARDRLYEFSQNGPGSNDQRAGLQWEDAGVSPLFLDVPAGEKITLLSNAADDGKVVTIYFPMVAPDGDNNPFKETLTLNHLAPPSTLAVYPQPRAIAKDLTTGYVTVVSSDSTTMLAVLAPYDTEPIFRRIKVSATSGTAHILFRRNRFKVRSQTDFIPVSSKMGLVFMVKALQAYRNDNFEAGQGYETQAIKLATEQQAQHNGFIELARASEAPTILNLNYANRDSIVVADIYDEACNIIGPVGQQKVFDRITEAVTCLSNKGQWDAQRGYVDLETDGYYYLTLPRYVDEVIKINMCNYPLEARSKWFIFHLNGQGSCNWCDRGWQDAGQVVTIRDVPYTQKLSAMAEFPADNGLIIRVYGYYQGKRIFTPDADGNNVDGFPVTVDINGTIVSSQLVDRIEEIVKPASQGFIKLYGYNSLGEQQILLGYYWPDETRPNYRRIKLPERCACITVMYRRRELKFTALSDPIHLRSKTAILLMLQSYQALMAGKLQDAEAMEQKAVILLTEEQRINNQSEVPSLEFSRNFADGYQGCIR